MVDLAQNVAEAAVARFGLQGKNCLVTGGTFG